MQRENAGMLVTSMDVAPEHDAEFNQWFDKEHLEERAAIPGFLDARRYIAIEGERRYLSVYATRTFDVLDGPDYRRVLANQTDRSKRNMANFIKPGRIVTRILASGGKGWGAYLGIFRLQPQESGSESLRALIARNTGELAARDHIAAAHFLMPDPELSRPLGDNPVEDPTIGDWLVLVESTTERALRDIDASGRDADTFGTLKLRRREIYQFLWGLVHEEAGTLNQ